jgi:hypothetical protein
MLSARAPGGKRRGCGLETRARRLFAGGGCIARRARLASRDAALSARHRGNQEEDRMSVNGLSGGGRVDDLGGVQGAEAPAAASAPAKASDHKFLIGALIGGGAVAVAALGVLAYIGKSISNAIGRSL